MEQLATCVLVSWWWCPAASFRPPPRAPSPFPSYPTLFAHQPFNFKLPNKHPPQPVLCANASVVHIIVVLSFVPLNYLSKPTSIFFRYVFCPVSVPDAVLSPSAAFVALLRRAPPSLCRHGVSHLVWVKLMIRHHPPGRRAGLVKALPSATMSIHDNLEYAGLQQVQGPETLDW